MLFKKVFHEGLRSGAITVTFRRWSRPQAREGGRYRTAAGVLEALSVTTVRIADIAQVDVRRSGFSTRGELLKALGGSASDEAYRIELRYVGPDPGRPEANDTKLTAEDVAALTARLDKMDRLSRSGPWIRQTLDLIAEHPRTRAAELAERAGVETRAFKANVRKLKNLGLTTSFEVGYEISPRGRALLRRWKRA